MAVWLLLFPDPPKLVRLPAIYVVAVAERAFHGHAVIQCRIPELERTRTCEPLERLQPRLTPTPDPVLPPEADERIDAIRGGNTHTKSGATPAELLR